MAQDSPKKNSTAKWIVIHIPELIASVALVFAITLTVINVFTRYCLHFTIKGSDEYVCIAFAWMVFPGTAACIPPPHALRRRSSGQRIPAQGALHR